MQCTLGNYTSKQYYIEALRVGGSYELTELIDGV